MGSRTEDAQPGFGDITAPGGPGSVRGGHIPPGQSRELTAVWAPPVGSWAPWPDPAPQQGKEALGTEPRRGGQPDHGRPHGITALTPTAGSGGQMGVPGRILPPGRCLRARRLVGRREQPFKGHCQRAALTTSAPHADSEKRESGSVIAACSVALPSAGS